MMNRSPSKPSRAWLPALLMAVGSAAISSASGCGRADSPQLDSETHWLTSCDDDLDCGAGSCECGVCTELCVTTADCAGLGVAGVECAALSSACGTGAGVAGSASSEGSACLLSCAEDVDCTGLGAGAVCARQRCERPARASVGGVGGTGSAGATGGSSLGGGAGAQGDVGGSAGAQGDPSASAAALCDGSPEVRFAWILSGGQTLASYSDFVASHGQGFLAIDGQCRFWRATTLGGPVASGVLSGDNAASFASTIGYEGLLGIRSFEAAPACSDGGTEVIWTPNSRITCACSACNSNPNAPPGWAVAFRTLADPRLDEWFGDAQPVTGPARLALIGLLEAPGDPNPLPWPLSRPPADDEIYPIYPAGSVPPSLDDTSGAEITDANELSALRIARDTYAGRPVGAYHTALNWLAPGEDEVVYFHMLLRDELPAPVQTALEAARRGR